MSIGGKLAVGGTTPAQPLDVTGNAQVNGGFILSGTTPFIYTGTGSTEAGRFTQIANTTQLATPAGLKSGGLLGIHPTNYIFPLS